MTHHSKRNSYEKLFETEQYTYNQMTYIKRLLKQYGRSKCLNFDDKAFTCY